MRRQRRTNLIAWAGWAAAAVTVAGFPPAVVDTPAARAGRVEAASGDQVKAAYLYNFLQFVEWPAAAFPDADAPYVIGVVGDPDPLAGAADAAVAGKRVAGRAVVVRHFAAADGVRPCHVLFVGAPPARDLADALDRVRGQSVLVVGDGDDVLDAGGTVRLFREDNRVRFEVSLKAADRAGLRVSSRLLKLAKIHDR